MTTKQAKLEPGTHIPSQYGHYQSAYIIELARTLGWQPKPQDTGGIMNTPRTQQEENEYVDNLAVTYQEWGNLPEGKLDEWYELVQEAEDYINEHHTPRYHWFGHHADIGDVGVWSNATHCEDNAYGGYDGHDWDYVTGHDPQVVTDMRCTHCGTLQSEQGNDEY